MLKLAILQIETKELIDLQMVRVTIRATDDSVPPALLKLMEDRLAAGTSPKEERIDFSRDLQHISDALSFAN